MIDVRWRGTLAAEVALGVVALLGLGFWIGRANPGSTPHPEIVRGTVTLVGGGAQVDEFVVNVAGSRGPGTSYPVGHVPWTDGSSGMTEGNTAPPCISVGHHITFGVVHVAYGGMTTDHVVWVDCTG
jgi:hypothetical protein